MKKQVFFATLTFLTAIPIFTGALAAGPPSPPVLVELFTSQGCSSCPPAEELLNSWGMELFKKGEILPLAFHVDYWNYLGWSDPFSSGTFTARQREYASFFPSQVYTPQMVVAGRVGFVGTNGSRAKEEVVDSRKTTSSQAFGLSAKWDGKKVVLDIDFSSTRDFQEITETLKRIRAVVFENGLVTKIDRGENAGRTLTENFVVRWLSESGPFHSSREGTILETPIPWDKDWNKSQSGIAVFLQDPSSFKVDGLKWVYPISEGRGSGEAD